jgi:hypothetical protein
LDQKEFINFLEDGNQINLENLEPEDFRKLPWKQKLKLKKLVEVLIKKIKKNKILIIKIILGASVSILVLYFVLPFLKNKLSERLAQFMALIFRLIKKGIINKPKTWVEFFDLMGRENELRILDGLMPHYVRKKPLFLKKVLPLPIDEAMIASLAEKVQIWFLPVKEPIKDYFLHAKNENVKKFLEETVKPF